LSGDKENKENNLRKMESIIDKEEIIMLNNLFDDFEYDEDTFEDFVGDFSLIHPDETEEEYWDHENQQWLKNGLIL